MFVSNIFVNKVYLHLGMRHQEDEILLKSCFAWDACRDEYSQIFTNYKIFASQTNSLLNLLDWNVDILCLDLISSNTIILFYTR